ncbi:MAG: nucleotidyltransferase substrate binding protein [bacterium]|nr:nucleotidyltransferase substrate binding protein [bacterium]MBU1917525.1 nucleotidyltransferase substrate binding protein [bacterium]
MATDVRWKQRFESFGQALERLEEALEQEAWKELEQDGVIKRFEFTFELAWKTLQDFYEFEGLLNIHGPKQVLKQAFHDGLIADGEGWIEILKDRNLMAHTYDAEASQSLFEKIRNKYFQALCDLYKVLEKK